MTQICNSFHIASVVYCKPTEVNGSNEPSAKSKEYTGATVVNENDFERAQGWELDSKLDRLYPAPS